MLIACGQASTIADIIFRCTLKVCATRAIITISESAKACLLRCSHPPSSACGGHPPASNDFFFPISWDVLLHSPVLNFRQNIPSSKVTPAALHKSTSCFKNRAYLVPPLLTSPESISIPHGSAPTTFLPLPSESLGRESHTHTYPYTKSHHASCLMLHLSLPCCQQDTVFGFSGFLGFLGFQREARDVRRVHNGSYPPVACSDIYDLFSWVKVWNLSVSVRICIQYYKIYTQSHIPKPSRYSYSVSPTQAF